MGGNHQQKLGAWGFSGSAVWVMPPWRTNSPGMGKAEPGNSVESQGIRSPWVPLVETTLCGLRAPSNLGVVILTSCLVPAPIQAISVQSDYGKLASSLNLSDLKLYH